MKQRVHYLLYIIKLILNHWGNTDFPLGFKECSTEKRKGEEKKKKGKKPKNPKAQASVSIWWPDSNTAISDLPKDSTKIKRYVCILRLGDKKLLS